MKQKIVCNVYPIKVTRDSIELIPTFEEMVAAEQKSLDVELSLADLAEQLISKKEKPKVCSICHELH